jgi:dUTP pyrophosphatase
VLFKRLRPDAIIPQYIHEGDSGFDLFSVENIVIPKDTVKGVHTGLAVELPSVVSIPLAGNVLLHITFELQIRPKSGLALMGLTVYNTPGTIDNGYRGELIVLVRSLYNLSYKIFKGDKIAQGVIAPVFSAPYVKLVEVDQLGETVRGERGFGSTGYSEKEEKEI